jgi:hypothetical protein
MYDLTADLSFTYFGKLSEWKQELESLQVTIRI